MKGYVLILTMILMTYLASLPLASVQQVQVSVSTDKSTYAPGELVTVTAIVKRNGEPYVGCWVGFEVQDPKGGRFPLPPVQTDSNGRASKSFRLRSDAPEGTWRVIAAVSGTNARDSCTFTVAKPGGAPGPTPGKKTSSITLELSSDTITYGECVIISGQIVAEESITADVNVEYSYDNVTWNIISTTTATNSSYSFSWCPPSAGTYFLRASWGGTDEYYGATSTIARLTVLKASVELSLSVSPSEVTLGEEVTISGELNPALAGVPVLIEYSVNGEMWTTLTTVNTNSEGHFSLRWIPPLGEIFIKASWSGNENYEGFSETISLIVRRARSSSTLTGGIVVEYSAQVNVTGEFHSDTWTLELNVQGPSGYSDVITVRVPADLLEEGGISIEDIVILVDGNAVDFIYRLEDDTYVISFTVPFSERRVRLILSRGEVNVFIRDDRNRPIFNALIEFYYEGKGLIYRGVTNESGLLGLKLPVGNYTAKILWRGVSRDVKVQVIREGASIEEVFKTYDLTVKVTSKILKVPIPAVVIVSRAGFKVKEVTDASGVCTFKQLPPGTYDVEIRVAGVIIHKNIALKEDKSVIIAVDYLLEYALVIAVTVAVLLAISLIIVTVWVHKRR